MQRGCLQLSQGFTLQASDFNRMLELATTVQESQIVSDNSLPPDQNVEVLKSTVRLLQLALDSQFQEVRIMTDELNDQEEESKVSRALTFWPGV